MDFILLVFCLFYFFKGYFKGFVSMLLSLIGTFFIFVVAWKISPICSEWVQNVGGLQEKTFDFISKNINSMFPGEFSSISEFESAVIQTKYGFLFSTIIKFLLTDITFDGSLSAGQILAPSMTNLVFRVLTFIFVFLFLMILLKFVRFLFNKIIKTCGLGLGNRWLGGFVGLFKGLVVFSIFYIVFSGLANFLMNESMLNFIESGQISSFLYSNFIKQIISIFY